MRLKYEDLKNENDFLLFLHTRPQADTVPEFEERLFQHIELTWNFRNKGCPLVDLNRRFCNLASKFKASVAFLVRKMSDSDRLSLVEHKGRILVFPKSEWIDFCKAAGVDGEGVRQREAVLDASLIRR